MRQEAVSCEVGCKQTRVETPATAMSRVRRRGCRPWMQETEAKVRQRSNRFVYRACAWLRHLAELMLVDSGLCWATKKIRVWGLPLGSIEVGAWLGMHLMFPTFRRPRDDLSSLAGQRCELQWTWVSLKSRN